jgi:hypothetical protein
MALTPTPDKKTLLVSRLMSLLMAARPQGHIYHLQTRSFAMHIALYEFYKGIGKISDTVIEAYQGRGGIVTGYKLGPMREDGNCVGYLEELSSNIMAIRYDAIDKEWTNLHNEIDNALTLIDQTLYKLKNLK